jgi:NitT/TauT family transport system substrate-binding protein
MPTVEVPVRSRSRLAVAVLTGLSLLVAACGPGGTSPSAPATAAPSASRGGSAASAPSSHEPIALKVGLGYIPSVQFAPFYLADQAGYYKEAGLDVTFRHGTDYDVIAIVAKGELDTGLADGTSAIPAVSQGIPIRYVATIYGQFPSIVFSKASAGIAAPADLKGKKVGIPGRYGASWIMLQALLGSANLKPDDLQIVEYPDFGQGAAVAKGAVNAATGFVNNEPVQLELAGTRVSILRVDQVTPLPGNGLVVGAKTLAAKHDALAAFVAATLRAMAEVEANPEVGLDAAVKAVPELGKDRETQAAILAATIDVWRGPVQEANGLGALDRDGWAKSIDYLGTLKLTPNKVTVDDILDPSLLPAD